MFGKRMPEDGKYHNFCRNPGGSQRAPFCWVKEGFPGPKFGYCDVPDCVSRQCRHEHCFISNPYRIKPLLKIDFLAVCQYEFVFEFILERDNDKDYNRDIDDHNNYIHYNIDIKRTYDNTPDVDRIID